MNLDDLRSVQNKERQKDSLQHLRESFYEDVSDYVEELQRQRDRAAEGADDPFASPEVRQLTDEIETVKDVTTAIYERRLGKLVKRASLAAADMPADEEGLTAEERELFNDLVGRIERNKSHVLDVVEGDAESATDPEASPDVSEPSTDRDSSTGVSDSLQTDPESSVGSGRSTDGTTADPAPGREDVIAEEAADVTDPGSDARTAAGAMGGDAADGASGAAGASAADELADHPGSKSDLDDPSEAETVDSTAGLDDRTTVRITRDVGEIFGVDEREYELTSETVVTLPEENAEPLLQRGAAERVDE